MGIYLFFSHMWHGWVPIKGIFYLKVSLLMFVLFLWFYYMFDLYDKPIFYFPYQGLFIAFKQIPISFI